MIYLIGTCFTVSQLSSRLGTDLSILPCCSVYFKKDGINKAKFYFTEKIFKKEKIDKTGLFKLTWHLSMFDCDTVKEEITPIYWFLEAIDKNFKEEHIKYKFSDLVNPESKLGEKVEIKESIWTKIKNWFKHNI